MKILPRKIGINLTGEGKRLLTRVFATWTINIGRIIIVTTELIALSALFYRFVIDREIIEIQDLIQNKERLVKSYEQKEKEFRDIQSRLSLVKSLTNPTDKIISALNIIDTQLDNENFEVKQISLNKNVLEIDGLTFSVFTLNTLVEDLKRIDEISSISLEKIDTKESEVEFNLKLNLKSRLEDLEIKAAPANKQKDNKKGSKSPNQNISEEPVL